MKLTKLDKFKLRHLKFLSYKEIEILKRNFDNLSIKDKHKIIKIANENYKKALNDMENFNLKGSALTHKVEDCIDDFNTLRINNVLFLPLGLGVFCIPFVCRLFWEQGFAEVDSILTFSSFLISIPLIVVGSVILMNDMAGNKSYHQFTIYSHPLLRVKRNKLSKRIEKANEVLKVFKKLNDTQEDDIEDYI